MKHLPLLLLSPLLLMACDTGPDLAKICKESPAMCEEFIEDTWCKKERVKTIYHNYALTQTGADKQKFDLLIAYEEYAACMDHASQIEHIKLKYKKRNRIDNAIKAKERIKQLSEETLRSEHPELLFYHWSRYLNEGALAKFLAMEGSKALETAASQFNLATYYIKRDPDKTLDLLFHALELQPDDSPVNTEIFKSITTIFTDKEEFKQAYIWLKILTLYDPEDIDSSEQGLMAFAQFHKLDADFLDKVASATLDKITDGTFTAPRH
ncbi:DUF2989 domain-containing protein [Thalassotalea euphylliae]|uniref:DUF2989 domain-containing protein n=1 Tax=Thalassotalea euphylliae TaxID=1655234 RepID=A0A3E0TY71_9GAMM|nr:DUF2989 domain-containing protein [Thalassotalea euphylliae]REL29596.1 DUF2989 domain-containing protein [Thalassotalea euphylliae]